MTIERRYSYGEEKIMNTLDKGNRTLRIEGLGFDIDGTEVDSATQAIQKLNRIFNSSYKKTDYATYWEMVEFIKKEDETINNPKEYAIKLWNSDDVVGSALPESGALILSRFLHEEGLRIPRITARPSYIEEITRRWYDQRMPWVDQSLINIQNTGRRIYPGYKVNKINEYNLGYFFEDQPKDAEKIVDATNAVVIIVPQPWNTGYSIPKNCHNRIIIPEEEQFQGHPRVLRAYFSLINIITQGELVAQC